MAPIVESIEIARRPEDVFAYMIDPGHLVDWQESLVRVRREDEGPVAVGGRIVTTRRIGRGERAMTMELTELHPPNSWAVRGVDGPIRGMVKGTVEPLENGERSRATINLDFEGHGIGKLLVPLVVRTNDPGRCLDRGRLSGTRGRPDPSLRLEMGCSSAFRRIAGR